MLDRPSICPVSALLHRGPVVQPLHLYAERHPVEQTVGRQSEGSGAQTFVMDPGGHYRDWRTGTYLGKVPRSR
jgi:hypothetical protein